MSSTTIETIVFHVPFPLNPKATSASGIRPVKMRQAFEKLGYHVLEVSGYHHERRAQMKNIRRQVREGLAVSFVYSEAATTPTGLGEPVTRHTSLTRDINFLRFFRRRGVPVGLFYRDIYWQFPEYAQRVKQPYTAVLRWRYRADLRRYRNSVSKLFLPSQKMATKLPVANQPQAHPLPPGAMLVDTPATSQHLNLLYVGGTGSYYQMQEAVAGIEEVPEATLTICTRESEWRENAPSYSSVLGSSTTVVHRSGAELEELYRQADIGLLFMEPIDYRDFAAPMKLFEYLGHGKPVIATEGSLAAELIEKEGFGWSLPYEKEQLQALLVSLQENPELLEQKKEQARKARHNHTWEARALQAKQALLGEGNSETSSETFSPENRSA